MSWRSWRCVIFVSAALLAGGADGVGAQVSELAEACARATEDYFAPEEGRSYCLQIAQAAASTQPRLGMAGSFGNPVPGTASTLGMKIGSLPRMSLGGRIGAIRLELPPIRTFGDDFAGREAIAVLLPSAAVEGAVGVFSGFSPAPTVGGVASVDALGSIGLVRVPGSDGFVGGLPLSWGLGARLGVLRESFTLPGISVTGMYRRVGDLEYGEDAAAASRFEVGATSWSVRAALSKRLFMLGATAGVGYDRYTSDVRWAGRVPLGQTDALMPEFEAAVDAYEEERLTAFVNVSWTLLVLHVVGQAGWQAGGDGVPGAPAHPQFDPESGAWYGGLALRLSI